MVTQFIGTIGEFESSQESWENYKDRFEIFIDVNGIPADKKARALLTCVGRETYSLLRDLCIPGQPSDKSFTELVKLLTDHLHPAPNVTAERYRFTHRKQKEGEGIADYVAALRKLSKYCEFGNNLDDRLKDNFIEGLRSETILKKLLAKKELKFTEAVDIALAIETADKDAADLRMTDPAPHVNRLGHAKKVSNYPAVNRADKTGTKPKSNESEACYRCGKRNHSQQQCFARDNKCNYCNKVGHYSEVCKTKARDSNTDKKSRRSVHSTRYVNVENDADVEVPMFNMSTQHAPPLLLTVEMNKQSMPFEIDTGSAVSVISGEFYRKNLVSLKLLSTTTTLKPYVGQAITPTGIAKVPLTYRGMTKEHNFFVVEGGGPPLLGRSFLESFHVDWESLHNFATQHLTLETVLQRHSDVFKDELGKIKKFKAKLVLKKDALPKFCRARPVPLALKTKIENELNRLVREGILEPVRSSEWSTPIVPVLKKNGDVRICADYGVTVNPQLEIEQYPLPKPEELFATLSGSEKFSRLDCRHAYTQMEFDEDSQLIATINTHVGLFKPKRVFYGIASGPALFQRAIEETLSGVPSTVSFQDDVLSTGTDDANHLKNLDAALERMSQAGLRLRRDKCVFLQDKVDYLGHVITKDGIHPLPEKVDAIVNAPTPTDVKQLRSFLGSVNYYGKFIPNLSELLHPLHQLLQATASWEWTSSHTESFKNAKRAISSAPVLMHYDPHLPLEVFADSSSYGLGAVLVHTTNSGIKKPIAFASRTLTKSEQAYAQIDKEALAIVFAVKKFHQYLFGRPFLIWTDHKPLTTLLNQRSSIPSTLSPRMQRYVIFLMGYSYTIKFLETTDNVVADMLSRLPLKIAKPDDNLPDEADCLNVAVLSNLPVTTTQLRNSTRRDPLLSAALRLTREGWPEVSPSDELKPFHKRRTELSIAQDCLLWGNRVVVPPALRGQVLQELHSGHLGIVRMKSFARQHTWWPGIDSQVEEMVRSCAPCQEIKPKPPKVPLHPWEWPSCPWSRLHADFAGPLSGQQFLLILDAHSKWPEVEIMKNTTAEETIKVFRTLFTRYGIPHRLVTDNGSQFTSSEFQEFVQSYNIKHTFTPPGHPATNGAAENFVGTFKAAFKAYLKQGLHSKEAVLRFLGSYRCVPHSTTGVTPAELLLGRTLRTRLDIMKPSVGDYVREKQYSQQRNARGRDRLFCVGDTVWSRDFRRGKKWTRATIMSQLGRYRFIVHSEDGLEWHRHSNQLRYSGLPHISSQTHPPTVCSSTSHQRGTPDPATPVVVPNSSSPHQEEKLSPGYAPHPERVDVTHEGSSDIDTRSPSSVQDSSPPTPYRTRSNRAVKPPVRLNL